MKSGVVSIILPVYNQEKYLNDSIPAVLGQSYEKLEVICVDDGSSDSSAEILKRYASVDERIKIVPKKNGGLVDATIAGIAVAEGEYICFLDPDDLIGTDFVKFFIDRIGDADFISAGYIRKVNDVCSPLYLNKDRVISANEIACVRKRIWTDPFEVSIPRWNKMYRAEIVKQVADKFRKYVNITLGEDTIFTYLMLTMAHSGRVYRDTNTYYYNISSTSSMSSTTKTDKHIAQTQLVFNKLKDLMQCNGDPTESAYMLYYRLAENLLERLVASDDKEYGRALKKLKADKEYIKALKISEKYTLGKFYKFQIAVKRICPFIFVNCILSRAYSAYKEW